MNDKHGMWISIGAGSLLDQIESSIHRRWEFSYSIPQTDYKPRRAELVIIALYGGKPAYLGLSVRGRPGTTGLTTVMISNLIRVKPLTLPQIRKLLPKRLSTNFDPPASGVYPSQPVGEKTRYRGQLDSATCAFPSLPCDEHL
jgi:hypothetical protein